MSVKYCHASIDERNKASGGVAGDQTTREVCAKDWSVNDNSKGWGHCLIYPDTKIRKAACEIAKKLAACNLVGYDQSNRNSLYAALKKNNFDVDKYIASGVKTETDCSAFVYAVYSCVINSMRSDGNAPTTSTMAAFYKKNGFKDETDSKYLKSSENLKAGYVLVKPGAHTIMIVEGADVKTEAPTKVESPKAGVTVSKSPVNTKKVEYLPACKTGYTSIVDALRSIGASDTTLTYRKKLAEVNGICTDNNYEMNTELLIKLKSGTLIKA